MFYVSQNNIGWSYFNICQFENTFVSCFQLLEIITKCFWKWINEMRAKWFSTDSNWCTQNGHEKSSTNTLDTKYKCKLHRT